MELSTRAIGEVVHPTAAFYQPPSEVGETLESLSPADSVVESTWENSLLNPKNRIDSLDLPQNPLWRVDGCAGLGTQYYVLPLFLQKIPPMRMDVFVSNFQPTLIREQLELHRAFHTKDAIRLPRLAITKHIVRILQIWTTSEFKDLAAFEDFYKSVPFGSRLVLEDMSLDVRRVRIKVGLNHNLEHKLLPFSRLADLWGSDFPFPQVIDFFDLHVVSILHDSVCLVRINEQLCIFKALTSGAKYLYHELKTLCTIEPHENIIVRPMHIVTKRCNFGTKKAVVGFTTFYHSKGTLRDVLPLSRAHGQLRRVDQLKWSIQLTKALEHLTRSGIYYPDLRLDNIVLSESSNIIMVDFEQRGVWCEFSAPEVNAIEYIRLIATDECVSESVSAKYRRMLQDLLPSFESLEDERYTNPKDGFNLPWIALSAAEQEAAEVYMLGRVLWCIFEGVSGPQKAAVWQSYRWEPDIEFPEYKRTPPAMRDLIDRCTRGRRGTLSNTIMRQHSQLFLTAKDAKEQSADDVREAAKRFWFAEIDEAERFLALRSSQRLKGEWNDNYYGRPTLKEVLEDLEAFQIQAL
ncbi:uncharacterized protein F4807DRAFT_204266 [Annulohypoxylon truncatum]|uniref:uncharacterized protein n=1 Tax=Annulohypoxylon truncatum TaxID=327061 RepID=UPI002007DEF9|nr:uncharacterized protein F4807DRAFT_204266 [Annulohypoxylon truncatum]KAI1213887.1 hypothetical protein F4807DRAFT_204266 [Annulohypoxylon truncatum]